MERIIDKLLDLLYPPKCAFCRALLENSGQGMCKRCASSLPYTRGAGQSQRLPFIKSCVSPLYYEDAVRDSLLRFKFNKLALYATIYGKLIANCIDENEISCDIITWVPLSRRRLRERGYDQARIIAQELSSCTGIECVRLLEKTRHTPAQSGMGDAAKRKANAQGAYAALDAAEIEGANVLIIDDIVTTGATLSECARVLTAAGARSVSAAALARKRD